MRRTDKFLPKDNDITVCKKYLEHRAVQNNIPFARVFAQNIMKQENERKNLKAINWTKIAFRATKSRGMFQISPFCPNINPARRQIFLVRVA